MNAWYFAKNYARNAFPSWYFNRNYKRLKRFEKVCDQNELALRLQYYFKVDRNFTVPISAIAVKNFKKTIGTGYFLDLKEFLHYFTSITRFAYHFGDETHINSYPTLFKARPIQGENANSILFKLNKRRHFKWVKDPYSFAEKKDKLVWRGGAYKYHKERIAFVKKFHNHSLCDVGQTNTVSENNPWQKEFMSIKNHLKFKFIFCIEGNDVATNLKWVMSSNSLCIMPKPTYETWFMEGVLKDGVHYVEVKKDFSDLEEKIKYYTIHIKEAEKIIENAHAHVARFKNQDLEDLLCLKVLEKYASLSGQTNARKFYLGDNETP